jgi:Putative transcriptional regulator
MQINKYFIIVLVLCRFGQNDAFTFIPTGSQSTLSTSTRKSLALEMSGKDNHRARVEKNLEDMMDRDWRLFRAKLVAQEAHDAQLNAERNQKRVSDISNDHDEKQAKQEKFGNIFAAFFHHKGNDDASIFNGDNIGTPESMIPDMCEDPFVSKDELPVLFQPKVNVNKHRWAHSLSHIEPGCVLIANEKLGGVFHQTVVLVIEHSDVTGSTGIIINR